MLQQVRSVTISYGYFLTQCISPTMATPTPSLAPSPREALISTEDLHSSSPGPPPTMAICSSNVNYYLQLFYRLDLSQASFLHCQQPVPAFPNATPATATQCIKPALYS